MARVENPASVGLAGSALGLAIPGTVALVNQLSNGNGFLGGLFGGGNNDKILALTAENVELKANRYTDNKLTPIQVELAKQGEQITCLGTQMALRDEIIDGKIALSTQTANTGFAQVNCAIACLQNTINSIARPFVPMPAIAGPPPFPPPAPPAPPTPPDAGTTTTSTSTNG